MGWPSHFRADRPLRRGVFEFRYWLWQEGYRVRFDGWRRDRDKYLLSVRIFAFDGEPLFLAIMRDDAIRSDPFGLVRAVLTEANNPDYDSDRDQDGGPGAAGAVEKKLNAKKNPQRSRGA